MSLTTRLGTLLLAALSVPSVSVARGAAQSTPDQMTIHVTVDTRSMDPVEDLTKDDFTLLDNRKPEPITGFRAVKGAQTGIIIMLDAVNLPYTAVSYAREQLAQYLSSKEGRLPQPTTVAVLQDNGVQIRPQFTTNGDELRSSLDRFSIGLRNLRRSAGVYGAEEQLQISVQAFQSLVAQRLGRGPTRIIWISPGWPLLSGPGIELRPSQLGPLFSQVVALTTELRRSNITADLINPVGAEENVGRSYYYENFLRAPRTANDIQLGDLGLQVIATQSGGLVLTGSNDIAGMLQRVVAQTMDGYELTFAPAPGERQNEYHELQVKVRRPGVTVHTTAGYYARPAFAPLAAATGTPAAR